jgi:SAM-dependent methyltransferase
VLGAGDRVALAANVGIGSNHPYTETDIGRTFLAPRHRVDLRRNGTPDIFYDANPVADWGELRWSTIGRPYRVERWSSEKRSWEREHHQDLPVQTAWELFNRAFQKWFDLDPIQSQREALRRLGDAAGHFHPAQMSEALEDIIQSIVWNRIHRVEDAVWDPRGKRALFAGLEVERPNILFLGAADGYEAMQLLAMYPGGHAVMVDYDDYCRTHRFGEFPADYPFLGSDPSTSGLHVWYREQMAIDFEVADIRNLKYGREFDIVLSVGLLEHFPDEHKPMCLDMHRRFLKPGGVVILTTPRLQMRSKLFYTLFADDMNFVYRELMDIRHMGLYLYENGFEILRHGVIKAHNGIVARPR